MMLAHWESLTELTTAADQIVVGQVTGLNSYWTPDGSTINTDVTIAPQRFLTGSDDGRAITLTLPGGTVGDVQIMVGGTPSFTLGERAILFLQGDPNGQPRLVGGFQGKFGLGSDGTVERAGIPVERFKERVRQAIAGQLSAGDDPLSASTSFSTGSSAFTLTGAKWADADIPVTYYINPNTNRPANLSASQVTTAVNNAFEMWEAVPTSYIAFSYLGTTTSLSGYDDETHTFIIDGKNVVSWGSLSPCNILGITTWAYWAGDLLEADIEFNSTLCSGSTWGTNGGTIDLETVALHEEGHFLGLDHSSVQQAVMYAFYQEVRRSLHQDDINGVTSLYPTSSTPTPSPTPSPTPPHTPTPTPTSSPTPTSTSTPPPTPTPEPILRGDADCTGAVNAVDALFVLRYAAVLQPFAACIQASDVECDGDIDAVDALTILRHVAGLASLTSSGCAQGIAITPSQQP